MSIKISSKEKKDQSLFVPSLIRVKQKSLGSVMLSFSVLTQTIKCTRGSGCIIKSIFCVDYVKAATTFPFSSLYRFTSLSVRGLSTSSTSFSI